MNAHQHKYNRYTKGIYSLVIYVFLFSSIGYTQTATDGFVESLHSFKQKPDVEVITVDEAPRRKKAQSVPQVDIKALDKNIWGGIPLDKLLTPRPEFKEYLMRNLTPDEYSKFYTAYMEGESASKENNLQKAVQSYTDAIAVAPFYYVSYMERAKILARHNKFSLAIQDLTAAIRANPQAADPYIYRAVTRTKERQYGLALEDYQSALYLIGKNPILLDKQGEIQLILDDFAGARISYTQAIEAKPLEARYYYQRAIANSGLNNYAGMIEDYLKAVNTNSYNERLIHIRNQAIQELEKKYYPREANPFTLVPSPESIFKKTAALPLYNPFQDISTITKSQASSLFISELRELQKELPKSTFRIIQSYVAREAYADALSVLQEYMQKTAKAQYGFTSKSMLVFVGYLNYMLGKYEDANTAYSVFLHTTRRYKFFYCNYVYSLLRHEGFQTTRDNILKDKEKVQDPIVISQILSYLAMLEGDYKNAITFMKEVNDKHTSLYYKLQLIALYALEQEYGEVYSLAKSVLREGKVPFIVDTYILYGLAALEDAKYSDAIENFSRAQELLPVWIAKLYSYIAVAKSGDIEKALDLITAELKNILLTSKERMELNSVKGLIEYDMGDYTKSLISYTVALNSDAKEAKKLYYNIAFLELKKKNYTAALSNINLYISAYPDDPLGFVLRGDIALGKKEIQAALEDYKKAIVMNPRSTYPYVHVANAIYALGMFDTAYKYYVTILEKSADDILNFILLAVINAQANNAEESLEYCKRILEKEPEQAEAHLIQGIIYQRLGNLHDAEKSYAQVIKYDPTNSFSYLMQGEIYEKQKEYRKAIAELTKAIDITPFATEAYIMRGLLYLYLGDKNAGLLDLEAGKRLYSLRQDKQSVLILESIIYNITKQLYIS